jgi:DNA-binding response OmpR family regulator
MTSLLVDLHPRVLLVKLDDAFTQRASLDLKDAGYETLIVSDAKQSWPNFEILHPDMIVLDRILAGDSGAEFCRKLRKAGHRVPILMLIERETVEERIACLEAGADDYLTKPYHSQAFLERVRFYLQPTEQPKEQLRFGNLVLDLTTRRAFMGGQGIDLTMKEFELLKYLMSHPQEVLTRDQILENVWGFDFRGESNVIEVYIRYLRLKIEPKGQKRLIHTVRGVGYVLRDG